MATDGREGQSAGKQTLDSAISGYFDPCPCPQFPQLGNSSAWETLGFPLVLDSRGHWLSTHLLLRRDLRRMFGLPALARDHPTHQRPYVPVTLQLVLCEFGPRLLFQERDSLARV